MQSKLTPIHASPANSTLQQLAITDGFPSTTDTQTCTYSYDDMVRVASANCGSVAGQTFTYDPFGNINKTGSPNSFLPVYTNTRNRISTVGSTTAQYDNNGNVLNDGVHTYAWDADGNSITVDAVGATFDALDRMVEQNRSSVYTEIVYAPTGAKLALMSGSTGQTLQNAFINLPGKATAVYTSAGLDHYRHADWLGSARLTSSPSRTVLSTTAYAPFGETCATYPSPSASADPSFTGQNSDTVTGDYDFLYREYSTQGRWPEPDPAGLGAVDPTNPQSWNRYAYVLNNPLGYVDPLGLIVCTDQMNENGYCSYVVNGGYVSASYFYSQVQAGFVGQCPNSNCGPITTPNGTLMPISPLPDGGFGGCDGVSFCWTFAPYPAILNATNANSDSWAWTFTQTFVSNFQLLPSSLRLPGESFAACVDRTQKTLLGNTGQTILNGATGVSTVASMLTQPLGTTSVLAPAGNSVVGKLAQVGLDSGATDVETAYQMSRGAGIVGKAAGVITAIGLGIEGGFAISCR